MKLEHDNVHFISDLHLYHKKRYENLDLTKDEHIEAIITGWNKNINDESYVFMLGDFSFGDNKETIEVLEQLKGNKVWILGNHDHKKRVNVYKKYFVYVDRMLDLYVKSDKTLNNKEYQHLHLCHFPIISWNKKKYNSFHIHGHMHGEIFDEFVNYYNNNYICDVGIDNCQVLNDKKVEFVPKTYIEIYNIFKNRKK